VDLEAAQSGGIESLFYLFRAFAGYNSWEAIDLVLIADYANEVTEAEESLNPASAAFFGLGKTVSCENPMLRCRAIDIDHYTDADQIVFPRFTKRKLIVII
jgi:hypothetical protein